MSGAEGTLYAGETYRPQVDFPEQYPMEAPQVRERDPLFFLLPLARTLRVELALFWTALMDVLVQVIFMHPAPMHPHIYSNGHICLGIILVAPFSFVFDASARLSGIWKSINYPFRVNTQD